MSDRIAYLTSAYPAVSHTFIAREVEALRRRGTDVCTMSIRRAPPGQLLTEADRNAAAETFSILPVASSRLLSAHWRAVQTHPVRYVSTLLLALRLSSGGARAALWQLFYFVEAMILWDECRRRGVSHVHAHFANVASAVAMLAASFASDDGLTWSFTMHGPTEFDDVSRFAIAEKVRSARFVACISDYCRSQLMKLVEPAFWPRLDVVHCGLDFAAIESAPLDDRERSGPSQLTILCVGRLVPDKGQLLLLEAAAELRRRDVDLHLDLVGDGPARPALETAVRRLGLSSSVSLHGSLGQDQVSALYETADVFCLPSFAEGVPVVLMEAMARALPVVTTRVAGVSELVDDQVSGAIVSAGRVDLLVQALEQLELDPGRRARWGRAGRRKVQRYYDVNESARRLAELFAGVRPSD